MSRTVAALCTGALVAAAPAFAVPVTLDFSAGSAGCGAKTIGTAITITQSSCAAQGGHQYLEPGQRLTLSATTGTTFDYLGVNTLVFWQEIFGIAAADVPAGVDPATKPGYDDLWIADRWSLVTAPLPILHTRGYRDGALVAEWNPALPDTYTHNASVGSAPTGYDLEARDVASPAMYGLDRLEFGFMENYLPAGGALARLVDDSWYTSVLGPQWAFTDLQLDIQTATTDPTPVPLPAGLGLFGLALGGLAVAGRHKRRPPR